MLGVNPIRGYGALLDGAFGDLDALADTAIKSIPLLLVGVGICIAFRASVINIGGEGQMIAGAIVSTLVALAVPDLPRVLLVPLVLLGGGVLLGVFLALVCRGLVAATARSRAAAADRRLREAVSEVASELVVAPVQAELTAYTSLRTGLDRALA